jgi:hypothetical protein
VTGVTWVELPPDAPEPPPLSVVRTGPGAARWLHADNGWELLDGPHAGDVMEWDYVARLQPIRLGQPEGPLWRRVESVEPSPYEVRHAALMAAANWSSGMTDVLAEGVIAAARVFAGYLTEDD